MREVAFSLIGDFGKAHRRFKYHPSEHGFLGCWVGDGDLFIYVNLVGTFGVASTPYQWARIAGCQIRVTHYMVGPGPGLELLLYADDLEALGIGRAGEPARFFLEKCGSRGFLAGGILGGAQFLRLFFTKSDWLFRDWWRLSSWSTFFVGVHSPPKTNMDTQNSYI